MTLRLSATVRAVALAGAARAITLPLSGVAGLLTTRLLVGQYGGHGFALYALIGFLPAIMPSADLGVGAAVLDAVARREQIGPEGVREVLRRGVRRLLLASSALVAVALIVSVTHSWQRLLGAPRGVGVDTAALLTVVVFAISMPISLGFRILQGLERTHTVVMIQGCTGLVTLAFVGLLVEFNGPLYLAPAAPGLATLVLSALSLRIGRPALAKATAALRGSGPRQALPRGLPLSGSFFLMSLALPISFQTDRVVLAHTQNLHAVAAYSAGSQLWAACISLAAAAGYGLWPVFARQRGEEGARSGLLVAAVGFTAVGAFLGLGLILLGPAVSRAATGGKAEAATPLMAAFAALLIVQCLQYPAGMYLLDPAGARFQAVCAVTMAFANLPVSVVLSRALGPSGPVIASTVLSLLIMTIPPYLWIAQAAAGRRVSLGAIQQRQVVLPQADVGG